MKLILKELDAFRGLHASREVAGVFLREVAEVRADVPVLDSGIEAEWQELRKAASYPHLQAAARALLELPRAERLSALPRFVNLGSSRGFGFDLIEDIPGAMIAELAGQVSSVRCSFGSAAMPALQIALAASETARDVEVRFIDRNQDLCDLVKLAASAIEVSIDVIAGQPFARTDEGVFEAEICMPPFNADIRDREALPKRTLDRINVSGKGRLHFEPVAMVDMLVHAPNARVISSFSAGALFRTVGLEAAVRSEIVESGRLAAVYAVPPGMIYTTTQIATSIMVLEPKGRQTADVRFVDLSDERFGAKTSRGQYDITQDASWVGALAGDVGNDALWTRDVPIEEIRAQNDVLAADRYLHTQSAEALSVFLSDYETRFLGELVEVIRPGAIPKSADGEYTIREASPGDIDETGFLAVPQKETQVAHGPWRKARNQQVRPGDVLLSVKGTIGRVGLIPEDAPGRDDENFWTAGQSLVVLRPKGQIKPEVLFEYLSNDLVQDHLGSLAGGAAIQSISAKDLGSLKIPIPSQEEQARVIEQARARHALFDEIERVRREIRRHRSATWPHNSLEREVVE